MKNTLAEAQEFIEIFRAYDPWQALLIAGECFLEIGQWPIISTPLSFEEEPCVEVEWLHYEREDHVGIDRGKKLFQELRVSFVFLQEHKILGYCPLTQNQRAVVYGANEGECPCHEIERRIGEMLWWSVRMSALVLAAEHFNVSLPEDFHNKWNDLLGYVWSYETCFFQYHRNLLDRISEVYKLELMDSRISSRIAWYQYYINA